MLCKKCWMLGILSIFVCGVVSAGWLQEPGRLLEETVTGKKNHITEGANEVGRALAPKEDTGSCTMSIIPASYYAFKVINATGNTISYSVNGTNEMLASDQSHEHKILRCEGASNGCGSGRTKDCAPPPVVSFNAGGGKNYTIGSATWTFIADDAGNVDLHQGTYPSYASQQAKREQEILAKQEMEQRQAEEEEQRLRTQKMEEKRQAALKREREEQLRQEEDLRIAEINERKQREASAREEEAQRRLDEMNREHEAKMEAINALGDIFKELSRKNDQR